MKKRSTKCSPKQETRYLKMFSEFENSIKCLERILGRLYTTTYCTEHFLSLELSQIVDLAERISSVSAQIYRINQNTATLAKDIVNVSLAVRARSLSNATKRQLKIGTSKD